MLDIQAIRETPLKRDPYPYMVIENAIRADQLDLVLNDFPAISHPGSIPLSEVPCRGGFRELVNALEGEAFRSLVAEKFSISLDGRPVMTTLRGVMREKDGRIHTDSKTKVITVLVYFNQDWQNSGGHLRVLRNGKDIEDYVEEIPPKAGTMVIFRVTDNCWHGHLPVVGKRLSIQMNYLTGDAARNKHRFFHHLSARIKKHFTGKNTFSGKK